MSKTLSNSEFFGSSAVYLMHQQNPKVHKYITMLSSTKEQQNKARMKKYQGEYGGSQRFQKFYLKETHQKRWKKTVTKNSGGFLVSCNRRRTLGTYGYM